MLSVINIPCISKGTILKECSLFFYLFISKFLSILSNDLKEKWCVQDDRIASSIFQFQCIQNQQTMIFFQNAINSKKKKKKKKEIIIVDNFKKVH